MGFATHEEETNLKLDSIDSERRDEVVLDAGGDLPLDLLVHPVVDLLLPDEESCAAEDTKNRQDSLERPELSLLEPGDPVAAARTK